MVFIPFLARLAEGASALAEPLTHDIALQWIPFRAFIGRAFSEGVFPLWTPNVFAGFPFAAFSHSGVFYPLGVLLHFSDYARSVNLFYPLHLFMAGAGAYALTRRAGASPLSSLVAAVAYTFTGKVFHFVHFLPSTCSNAWTPWFLFAGLSLLKSGPRLHFVLAGVFFGLQVLGGDVESTAYGLLLGFPALFFLAGGGAGRRWLALFVAVFLGALLSQVQLLPLMNLSERFVRNQGVTFSYFSQRSLPLALLWAVLFPAAGLKGQAAASGPLFYLGLVSLSLGFAGVARGRERGSRALACLFLVSLLWSFGSVGVVDRLQFLLPVLSRFGTPEHSYFMGQLFLAILAGRGLDHLRRSGAGPAAAVLSACVVASLFAGLFFELFRAGLFLPLLFAAAVISVVAARRLAAAGYSVFVAFIFLAVQCADVYGLAIRHLPGHDPAAYAHPEWMKKVARRVRESNSRYVMVTRSGINDPELTFHAGLALDMDAMTGWITVPLRDYAELLSLADPRAARFADGKLDRLGMNAELKDGRFIEAGAMPILDLLSLGWVIDRGVPLKFSHPFFLGQVPPELHRRSLPGGAPRPGPGGLSLFAAGGEEVYRFRLFVNRGDKLAFYTGAWHGGGAPAEFHARVEVHWGDTAEVLFERSFTSRMREPVKQGGGMIELELSGFALRTVELVFATSGPLRLDTYFEWGSPAVVNPDKPFVYAGSPSEGIALYENRERLERARVVREYETAAEGEDMLRLLGEASRYTFRTKVFLASEPGALRGGSSALPDGVRLLHRRPGEEVYRVSLSRPGFLFLADQYYPGWRCFYEGREVRIMKADHCFRAVALASGTGIVRFVYSPFDFRTGLYASLSSALFIMASALMRKRGAERRKA